MDAVVLKLCSKLLSHLTSCNSGITFGVHGSIATNGLYLDRSPCALSKGSSNSRWMSRYSPLVSSSVTADDSHRGCFVAFFQDLF